MSKIHLISIGGAVMHNIALALKSMGHEVSGSDDEIYEPSKSRLQNAGLINDDYNWDPNKITKDLDFIILGMHAKKDNPEILKAQELGLKIYSFPEFIYEASKDKKRIVVGGSQGKTTTTSMIMWVLKKAGLNFDYLVGAQLADFDQMVRISDAPIIVIEGDEYLSSPLDLSPKILHYNAEIGVLTGIDWDHMNVFPTLVIYKEQFRKYIDSIISGGSLIYYDYDDKIKEVISASTNAKNINLIPYTRVELIKTDKLQIFGEHNRANLAAALEVCKLLDIKENEFWEYISDFKGAAKRLQKIYEDENVIKFLDFAHAPAKVKATVNAVRKQYPNQKLYAFYELHTFSSLNKDFLPQYSGALQNCDKAIVLYSSHTLKMREMPSLDKEVVKNGFSRDDLEVFDNISDFENYVSSLRVENGVFLFMSSGNFGGIDLKKTH